VFLWKKKICLRAAIFITAVETGEVAESRGFFRVFIPSTQHQSEVHLFAAFCASFTASPKRQVAVYFSSLSFSLCLFYIFFLSDSQEERKATKN
jgi:hypothetical protein